MVSHGLFVTGTDTGVGKTVVTAAIARTLRCQGRAVRVCKPVATGSTEDTDRLAEAAGDPDRRAITPWTFAEPLAPAVAARRVGQSLSLREMTAAIRSRSTSDSFLLVEGVGGLLCPLTDTETVADLASHLGLSLLIVARRSLGTLNHTLLTLEAARSRRLPIAGLVVCETEVPTSIAEATNVDELRCRIEVPLLAVVPFRSDPWQITLEEVDWWGVGSTAQTPRPASRAPQSP